MPRYLFTIQYLGTRYAGWQTQTNAVGIQQVIEEQLTKMCGGESVKIEGSGRTDAGVHARGQRAHADLPRAIPPRGLILGLNDLLPHDIRIVDVQEVDADFHARFSATGKTYVYQIWADPVADVFHRETFAWVPATLDLESMRIAASSLVGEHDFRSFTVAAPEVSSTIRRVDSLELRQDGREIFMTIAASGFLRYMVRRIAGLLIEIGRGRLDPAATARAVEPEFAEARWTAPANGLVLERVTYADARP